MKKMSLMISALVVLAASAYAAPCLANGQKVFCQWASGCWQVDDSDDSGALIGCETQAGYCPQLYTGATQGNGANQCASSGGTTFTNCTGCWGQAAGVVWCDFGPPSQYGDGGCFQKTAEDCATEGGTAVSSQSQCGSSPTTTGPFCYWEPNADNDNTCYCGVVEGAIATAANCTDAYGTIVTSCTGYCGTNPPPGTPITVSGRSVGLTVIPNGNVLHIISERNATVELFSMNGAKVFSSKVAAGNSTLSLEKQRQGVYYAVVKSGSQKQTVKVVLK